MNLKAFLDNISEVEIKAKKAFDSVDSMDELESFFVDFLGKNGELLQLLKELKHFDVEEKKNAGPVIQQAKNKWQALFLEKKESLEYQALEAKLKADWIDVTKGNDAGKGNLHPISKVQKRIEEIFLGLGFEVADGPEVDTEWFNFDALNIPHTHPARDMQDTFFIKTGESDPAKNTVMRTQTSNIQVRTMLKHGAPVRLIAPGRVFRNEDIDTTHDATFYQVEGLLIDKDISLSHLKGVLETMLSELFEKAVKIRIRPGYFPFVEPGLEVDFACTLCDGKGCKTCKNVGWIEFMGAGMVHPNVLRNGGIDPEVYSGFAFGFGLTRLVMMKYKIEDIRLLSLQKKEFLEQF